MGAHSILRYFAFAFVYYRLNALNLDSTLGISKNKDIELILREDCEYALFFLLYVCRERFSNLGAGNPSFLNLTYLGA